MKTFKQKLTELVTSGTLTKADVDELISINTDQILAITTPLNERISAFEAESDQRSLESLGKFAPKDLKILKDLTKKQGNESYGDALKRTMENYGIEPIKDEPKPAAADNNSAVVTPNPDFKEKEKEKEEKSKDDGKSDEKTDEKTDEKSDEPKVQPIYF